MYLCNSLRLLHKSTRTMYCITNDFDTQKYMYHNTIGIYCSFINVSRPQRVDRLNDFSLSFTKGMFKSRIWLSNYDTKFDLQDLDSSLSGVCLAIETTRIPWLPTFLPKIK